MPEKKKYTKEEKKNYYKPPVEKDISSGDPLMDFLYYNQWIYKLPTARIIIDKLAKQYAGYGEAINLNLKNPSYNEIKKEQDRYTGGIKSVDEDRNIDLLGQYFSKKPILTKSRYKPSSDYLEFLPTYSIKDRYFQNKSEKEKDEFVKQTVRENFALNDVSYEDFLRDRNPVYNKFNTEGYGSKNFGVDLGKFKTGFGWDKEKDLPYYSISDAWDFYPEDYTKMWSPKKMKQVKDKNNDNLFIEIFDEDFIEKGRQKTKITSSLLHMAGHPYKIYDRIYFDPKTLKYIEDLPPTKSQIEFKKNNQKWQKSVVRDQNKYNKKQSRILQTNDIDAISGASTNQYKNGGVMKPNKTPALYNLKLTEDELYSLGGWLKENAGNLFQTVAGGVLTATGLGAEVGIPMMVSGGAGLLGSATADKPDVIDYSNQTRMPRTVGTKNMTPNVMSFKQGGDAKVAKVMKEFKQGKLHSGSKKGPVVKNRKQAIAIALSEAGLDKYPEGGEFKNKREYIQDWPETDPRNMRYTEPIKFKYYTGMPPILNPTVQLNPISVINKTKKIKSFLNIADNGADTYKQAPKKISELNDEQLKKLQKYIVKRSRPEIVQDIDDIISNTKKTSLMEPEKMALGVKRMYDRITDKKADGGSLQRIEGPSHEQGGVQLMPNIEVEGGETIKNNVVNSDNWKITKQVAKIYNLRPSSVGKTPAQYSKLIDDEFKKNENMIGSKKDHEIELDKISVMSAEMAEIIGNEPGKAQNGYYNSKSNPIVLPTVNVYGNKRQTSMSDIPILYQLDNSLSTMPSYNPNMKYNPVTDKSLSKSGNIDWENVGQTALGLAPMAVNAFLAARTAAEGPDKVKLPRLHYDPMNPRLIDPTYQIQQARDAFATGNEAMSQISKKDYLRRRIQSATEEGKVTSGIRGQAATTNAQLLNNAEQINKEAQMRTDAANLEATMQEENINAANKGAWQTSRDFYLSNLGTMAGEYARDLRLEDANALANERIVDMMNSIGEGIGVEYRNNKFYRTNTTVPTTQSNSLPEIKSTSQFDQFGYTGDLLTDYRQTLKPQQSINEFDGYNRGSRFQNPLIYRPRTNKYKI